jgi:hypothetical protein
MKRVLIFSLMLNVGLLCVVLARHGSAHHPPAINPPSTQLANRQSADLPTLRADSLTPAKQNDVNSWLDSLRNAGVPNRILASVVIADLENRWEAKERDLQQKFDTGDVDADALTQLETERVAEREQALRTALGEHGYREWDKENTLRDLNLGSVKLADAESDSLYQLRKNLAQSQRDLEQASRDGKLDGADLSQKLSALQTQYESDARTLLGNDRYAAMNHSPDPVAADLRRQTKDLHPSDDQLGALAAAQKQWNEQRAALDRQLESGQLSPEQHDAQMQTLNASRDQAYQTALGTNAFADFQKTQDANYQAMKHYAAAWQLSESDIDYLYRTLQNSRMSINGYQQQAQMLQGQGRPVDWSSVQQNISQFSGQVEQALQTYLGEERFKKLEENKVLTLGN